jgi:dTMP kinase
VPGPAEKLSVMTSGRFIVLEGVDGAGTTTHTRLLAESLRAQGRAVRPTREPTDGPIGTMIRQMLSGRLVVPGLGGPRPPSWGTLALLFAADRLDHLEAEIDPNVRDGVIVLSDRYVHSSLAYQSLSAGGDDATRAWIQTINAQARQPDLTIVLDVPAEVTRARRRARSAQDDLYEEDTLQARLVAFYATIESYFPGERIVHVDAHRAVDVVAAEIRGLVNDTLAR